MYIEEYYKMSCHITNDMPPHFNGYFSKQLGNLKLLSEIENNMKTWLDEAKSSMQDTNFDISLQVFIWYILSTAEASETVNVTDHRNKFNGLKRERKRNLFKVVKEEYEKRALPRNPMFLSRNTELYFTVMKNNPDVKQYESIEEYQTQKFMEVEEWFQDATSDICQFLFFDQISEKRQARYMELDLGYRIYDQIINAYYGNAVDGFVTRTPRESISVPAFSFVSRESPIAYDITDTVLTLYDNYESSNGQIVKTIVDEIPGNYTEIIEKNGQDEYVRQLILKQHLYPAIKLLDAKDSELLTAINSMFNIIDINKGQKTIPLSVLCKIAYADSRKKYYLQTIAHLNRLANYRVNYTQRGEKNQIINTGIMSFFDIDFQISDLRGEHRYTTITESDSYGNVSLIHELEGYDLRNINVTIQPSANLRKALKNRMNIRILTCLYDKITHPKAKMLLMHLQNIRTDGYPQTSTIIPLEVLAEQLRITHLRKLKIRNIISSTLEILKQNQTIIKSYEVTSKLISIEFIEITELEKEYYQLTDENVLLQIGEMDD